MLKTRFRHQFLKVKTPEAKANYNTQRSICVSLTRKAKRNYSESLNLNNFLCNNKKFRVTVKPLSSNKIKPVENIVLRENGALIKGEEEVANISGHLFSRYIATSINRCITGGTISNAFKKAVVRPIYKKDGRKEKSNYRPISVLSNIFRIYERCIYKQMYSYLDKIFSKSNTVFVKTLILIISI